MAARSLPARRLPDDGRAAWSVVKERGYEGLVAKDAESAYRSGPTRSWVKVKIRRGKGASSSAASSGCRSPSAGIVVGQRIGRRLLYRVTVEWGVGLRTAQDLLRRGRERSASPFNDFRLSRGVTWLHVELTYSELMGKRLRDPVYRGLA